MIRTAHRSSSRRLAVAAARAARLEGMGKSLRLGAGCVRVYPACTYHISRVYNSCLETILRALFRPDASRARRRRARPTTRLVRRRTLPVVVHRSRDDRENTARAVRVHGHAHAHDAGGVHVMPPPLRFRSSRPTTRALPRLAFVQFSLYCNKNHIMSIFERVYDTRIASPTSARAELLRQPPSRRFDVRKASTAPATPPTRSSPTHPRRPTLRTPWR